MRQLGWEAQVHVVCNHVVAFDFKSDSETCQNAQ